MLSWNRNGRLQHDLFRHHELPDVTVGRGGCQVDRSVFHHVGGHARAYGVVRVAVVLGFEQVTYLLVVCSGWCLGCVR